MRLQIHRVERLNYAEAEMDRWPDCIMGTKLAPSQRFIHVSHLINLISPYHTQEFLSKYAVEHMGHYKEKMNPTAIRLGFGVKHLLGIYHKTRKCWQFDTLCAPVPSGGLPNQSCEICCSRDEMYAEVNI